MKQLRYRRVISSVGKVPPAQGRRLGRPWEGVKVYGSVGDAEGHQSHFYRFNLYYRLEAF